MSKEPVKDLILSDTSTSPEDPRPAEAPISPEQKIVEDLISSKRGELYNKSSTAYCEYGAVAVWGRTSEDRRPEMEIRKESVLRNCSAIEGWCLVTSGVFKDEAEKLKEGDILREKLSQEKAFYLQNSSRFHKIAVAFTKATDGKSIPSAEELEPLKSWIESEREIILEQWHKAFAAYEAIVKESEEGAGEAQSAEKPKVALDASKVRDAIYYDQQINLCRSIEEHWGKVREVISAVETLNQTLGSLTMPSSPLPARPDNVAALPSAQNVQAMKRKGAAAKDIGDDTNPNPQKKGNIR